jgi:hypothetical protein
MVVWVLAGYGCVQVEGRESEREKHFQKSFSSLPLHAQGRRSCIVQVFFFLKKRKGIKFGSGLKMSYENKISIFAQIMQDP